MRDRFRVNHVQATSGPSTPARPAIVTAPTAIEALERQNAYLKLRNAQLQDDLTSLNAEAERLRQIVERIHGRSAGVSKGTAG